MVGRKTEKSRLKRSLTKVRELMRKIKHYQIKEQAKRINQVLRGHYAYYGLGGNHRSLWAVIALLKSSGLGHCAVDVGKVI